MNKKIDAVEDFALLLGIFIAWTLAICFTPMLSHGAAVDRPARRVAAPRFVPHPLDGKRIPKNFIPPGGKCLKCLRPATVFRYGTCPLCNPQAGQEPAKPRVIDPRHAGTAD